MSGENNGEFSTQIIVRVPEHEDTAEVIVATEGGKEIPFVALMCMTEYLMHIAAQRSNAGYEGALELLVKGAMTWRHRLMPEPEP